MDLKPKNGIMKSDPNNDLYYGELEANVSLVDFCVHLAMDKSLDLKKKNRPKSFFPGNQPFEVQSVERGEYPLPHLIRGVLTEPLFAGDEYIGNSTSDVVIELRPDGGGLHCFHTESLNKENKYAPRVPEKKEKKVELV